MTSKLLTLMFLSIWFLPALAADPDQALANAAAHGRYQQLMDLIADGANVDAKNRAGRPALALAAYYGNYMSARILLGAGANPNQRDSLGNTALMEAAAGGHPRLVRLLLAAGADPILKNNAGDDALTRASLTPRAEQVAALLKSRMPQEEPAKQTEDADTEQKTAELKPPADTSSNG